MTEDEREVIEAALADLTAAVDGVHRVLFLAGLAQVLAGQREGAEREHHLQRADGYLEELPEAARALRSELDRARGWLAPLCA